jgi:hypothetical protein
VLCTGPSRDPLRTPRPGAGPGKHAPFDPSEARVGKGGDGGTRKGAFWCAGVAAHRHGRRNVSGQRRRVVRRRRRPGVALRADGAALEAVTAQGQAQPGNVLLLLPIVAWQRDQANLRCFTTRWA